MLPTMVLTGTNKPTNHKELTFPYVYFHSGDYNMKDPRMVYAVNVVHGGQEFASNYLLDMDFRVNR